MGLGLDLLGDDFDELLFLGLDVLIELLSIVCTILDSLSLVLLLVLVDDDSVSLFNDGSKIFT